MQLSPVPNGATADPPPMNAVAVPTLAQVQADPSIIKGLSRPLLVDLRRQMGYLAADLDAAISLSAKPAPQSEPNRLMEVPEAAQRMGMTKERLYELIRQVQFPAIQHGRKFTRVRESDVDAFIETGCIAGVDCQGSVTLPYSHGSKRAPSRPQGTRTNPGPIRRVARRPSGDRQEVGDRRPGDATSGRPADPVSGNDRTEHRSGA